jgi:hypothetical protein
MDSQIDDLKKGNALAAAGKLDEALAAYQSFLAACRAKIESGTSLKAIEQVGPARHRIGKLAMPFLLAGNFECARRCAVDALADHPNSIPLNLVRAHAIMFLDGEEEALTIYRSYRNRKMPFEKRFCVAVILETFLALRQAGLEPPLMGEIQQWVFDATGGDPKSSEPVGPAAALDEASVQEAPGEIATALPPDIEAGDKLLAENKLEEALTSYCQGRTLYQTRITADCTDLRAIDDMDLVISRIGELAFRFLFDRNNNKRALKIIEDEALPYRPDWVRLHLIHAHAHMLTAGVTAAMNLHRKYYNQRTQVGVYWGAAIRADFDALRRAGYRLPVMDEIKRQFAGKP